jgi:DNA-binding winged helix-turn-helix (wHTH) protein/tetratricopeptide (TPR) repeat protein
VDENRVIFDPFWLDLANECLWRGPQAIKLRPKAFAVLHYLLERSGQLVTKEQLLNAVWPETFVTDAVLKVTIRQLRNLLGDDPNSPQFIETAHRRGYRFIAKVGRGSQQISQQPQPMSELSSLRDDYGSLQVVGRDNALSLLRRCLEKMHGGQRQLVFVTGEAGIGKTTLVDSFARIISSERNVRIARGQCLEHYGTSEPYLPIFDVIGQLSREHPEVIDTLRTHAPMWLLQMSSLVSASERQALSREVAGASRERMLREIGNALEALTESLPLVLILEDLQWSDYSTLDLISFLSKQRQSAHLMVIGTYRTAELIASKHPLRAIKQELLAKQQCEELALEYLSEAEVAQYLTIRFPANRFPSGLASLIHKRTDGNPLFMVHAVNHLMNSGLIVESDECWNLGVDIEEVEVGVPDSIKQLIENQLDHLDPEHQRILHAASVAGTESSTLAIAAASGDDRAVIERGCSELARRHQFLNDCGIQVLPNGEAVGRYGFIHAIYQNMLYERVPASRRMQMHRRIAELGEAVYGEQSREIAAKLALHFERGRDYKRAAKYLEQAAQNSIRRFAYREAVSLARRGLESLSKLPDSAERAEQELSLQLTLGVPLIATEGYAAPEVGSVYVKARELCQQLGSLTPDVSEVLWGLRTYHTLRAEFATAHEIAEEFLSAAARLDDAELRMRGHWALETIFLHQGKFTQALEHYDKALALYDPKRNRDDAFTYAQNPSVAMRCFAAWGLWFVGLPDQALARIQEAVALARESSDPHGLAQALFFAAIVHQLRQEEEKSQENAEAAMAVCRERGLVLYQAMATTSRGWALVLQDRHDEGFEQLAEGLTNHRLTGAEVLLPHFLGLLVEAFRKTNQIDEGLRILEEALEVVQRNGEAYYLAELYRLKGELLLAQTSISQVTTDVKTRRNTKPSAVVQAETCFQKSIKLAQKQKAKSWELKSAISLARLYQHQNRYEEAHNVLAKIYSSFTEGFDTIDLREAKALLNELQENNQHQPQKRTRQSQQRTSKEGRFTPAGA